MNDQSIRYWLTINKIPNVGPVTIRKIWEHFSSLEMAWQANETAVLEIEGISKPAARAFIEYRSKIDLAEEYDAINNKGISALTLEDDEYPAYLKNIYDPPPVLYIKGDVSCLNNRSIAIVGTRRASRYGLDTARKFAEQLALAGFTIVSGLALGIDTAAHQGTIAAKGKTIAAMGSGVDYIYPPQNRSLASEIERNGALVSEFPLGEKGEKGNFPRRNRVISGLSIGTIVVEGHYDSGAMITAKYALDQGREVFAVPGQVGFEQSKGPHWLIKQGAKLVENVQDVLEEIDPQLTSANLQATDRSNKTKNEPANLTPEEKLAYAALNDEPKHIDQLAIETGLAVAELSGLLLTLEMKKAVRQLPGKTFILS